MAAHPLPPHGFSTRLEVADGLAILRCDGYLVGDFSENLFLELTGLSRNYKVIELELSNLRRIDSSGLGVLVASYVAAKKEGCAIKLVNPSPRVKTLLLTTHLASVFTTQGM